TDCLNFGSPERPEIMRQFARAIDGMAAACNALGVPIVSGNVSLYNETDGRAILPTPTIGAVGQVRDPGDVVRSTFPAEGLTVLLLGPLEGGPLGGSEYVASRTGEVKGPPPGINLIVEQNLQALMLEMVQARPRLIESAHDVSEGGLATALVECAVGGDDEAAMIGATIVIPGDEALPAALFGEAPSRIVVTAKTENLVVIEQLSRTRRIPVYVLGVTGGRRLSLTRLGEGPVAELELAELRRARESCLASIVGD
ncbi:MAG: AIR synthase related protein, partial [Byssovorax sp.]